MRKSRSTLMKKQDDIQRYRPDFNDPPPHPRGKVQPTKTVSGSTITEHANRN